ncbi:MAG: hypothetical protein AB7E49_04105 [Campylobacterales bacterium]
MTDFHKLTPADQARFSQVLNDAATAIGGKSFFLSLVETVRGAKPAVIINPKCTFEFPHGRVKWNKVIFQDKIELLAKRAKEESLLPPESDKKYKTVFNMVRTLGPVRFEVTGKIRGEYPGFGFDVLSESGRIDPLFEAIFLSPVAFSREAFRFTPPEAEHV